MVMERVVPGPHLPWQGHFQSGLGKGDWRSLQKGYWWRELMVIAGVMVVEIMGGGGGGMTMVSHQDLII